MLKKEMAVRKPFDENKIARGVSRSGTPFLMAKDIAKSIHKKLMEKSDNNAIRSIDIKDYVVEELKSRNEGTIAESFSGYSKTQLPNCPEATTNTIQKPVPHRDPPRKITQNSTTLLIMRNQR